MSKPENRNGMGRASMEQMSTAGLEKLLLDDFYSPEDEGADMGELYMAAQILGERETGQCDCADRAWDRFRENYLPFAVALREDGGAPFSDGAQGHRHSLLRRWLARAALIC